MWYLISMLWFTLIYAFLDILLFEKKNKEIIRGVIIISLFFIGNSSIKLPRLLNNSLILILYYYLGNLYVSYRDKFDSFFAAYATSIKVSSIVLVCIGLLVKGDWARLSCISIPTAVAGIYLVIKWLAPMVNKNTKLSTIICLIGKNTMWVLGTHLLAFKLVSLLYIKAYNLPLERLGEFNIIHDVK